MRTLKNTDYLWLVGIPASLNYIACQVAIPYFEKSTTIPIEIIYFLCVGIIALLPMFIWAIYLSGKDIGSFNKKDVLKRMRIKKLSKRDLLWTVSTFTFLCLFSFLIAKVIMPEIGMDATPFFFKNMPLDNSHKWIVYVWPIFFFFNILGEEFLWRGYIQPQQEVLHNKWTWLVHGVLWALWHFPMGLDLVVASLPIFFILPAVVQIRKNTTIAIIVHTVFGGFGFIAIALGGVH